MKSNSASFDPVGGTQFLNQRELQKYHREGFLVVRNVFTAAEVALIRGAFERLHNKSQRFGRTQTYKDSLFVIEQAPRAALHDFATHRVVWAGGAEPILERLGHDARLIGFASDILETPAMVQLINQAHFKHPNDGVAFDWHQDSKHRRQGSELFRDLDGRGSFVETLTAIDPMTTSNGPLEILVGSHSEGHLGADYPTQLPRLLKTYAHYTVSLEPGDVLLLSPFTTHRSLENTGKHARFAFLNGFALLGASRRIYPGCGLGRYRRVADKSS